MHDDGLVRFCASSRNAREVRNIRLIDLAQTLRTLYVLYNNALNWRQILLNIKRSIVLHETIK